MNAASPGRDQLLGPLCFRQFLDTPAYHRDPKKFAQILESIRNLGLKKPIQVSLRSKEEGDEPGYDLVSGQGRIEAFQALGFTEMPAIVVAVSKEDRLVRSLVENMARRMLQPLDLIREIVRLRANGDTNVQIARKLGISDLVVGGLLALHKAGEERLLEATIPFHDCPCAPTAR